MAGLVPVPWCICRLPLSTWLLLCSNRGCAEALLSRVHNMAMGLTVLELCHLVCFLCSKELSLSLLKNLLCHGQVLCRVNLLLLLLAAAAPAPFERGDSWLCLHWGCTWRTVCFLALALTRQLATLLFFYLPSKTLVRFSTMTSCSCFLFSNLLSLAFCSFLRRFYGWKKQQHGQHFRFCI